MRLLGVAMNSRPYVFFRILRRASPLDTGLFLDWQRHGLDNRAVIKVRSLNGEVFNDHARIWMHHDATGRAYSINRMPLRICTAIP